MPVIELTPGLVSVISTGLSYLEEQGVAPAEVIKLMNEALGYAWDGVGSFDPNIKYIADDPDVVTSDYRTIYFPDPSSGKSDVYISIQNLKESIETFIKDNKIFLRFMHRFDMEQNRRYMVEMPIDSYEEFMEFFFGITHPEVYRFLESIKPLILARKNAVENKEE